MWLKCLLTQLIRAIRNIFRNLENVIITYVLFVIILDNVVGGCYCVASFLSQYRYCRELDLNPSPGPCCLIVDCGYSFTHLIPYYDGHPISKAVQRYLLTILVEPSCGYVDVGLQRHAVYCWLNDILTRTTAALAGCTYNCIH